MTIILTIALFLMQLIGKQKIVFSTGLHISFNNICFFPFLFPQADNQVDHVRHHFYEVSLEYVFKVQEVQERKMFEFVEPVTLLQHNFVFISESISMYLTFITKYIGYCRTKMISDVNSIIMNDQHIHMP